MNCILYQYELFEKIPDAPYCSDGGCGDFTEKNILISILIFSKKGYARARS